MSRFAGGCLVESRIKENGPTEREEVGVTARGDHLECLRERHTVRIQFQWAELIDSIARNGGPPAIAGTGSLRKPPHLDFVWRVRMIGTAAHQVRLISIRIFEYTIVVQVRSGVAHSEAVSHFMSISEEVMDMKRDHSGTYRRSSGISIVSLAHRRGIRIHMHRVIAHHVTLSDGGCISLVTPEVRIVDAAIRANRCRDDIARPRH